LKKQTRRSAWSDFPDYRIDIASSNQRVRIIFNGKTIADSKKTLILKENNYNPVYYFPRNDVRMNLLYKTSKLSFCPFKGEASHWSLTVDNLTIEVAAWSYENPFKEVEVIGKFITFYPDAIDKLIRD